MKNIIIFLLIILFIIYNKNINKIENFENKVNLLFKNQYLITNNIDNNNINNNLLFNLNKKNFDNYNIYLGNNLEFNSFKNNKNSIFLIGYIIDPINYKLNNLDIIKELSESKNIKEFLKNLQNKSGRFVIYFNCSNNKIILNDACSLKRIYYIKNRNNLFSSSENILLKYLNKKVDISQDKKEYINSKNFRNSEFKWFSDDGLDENTKLILPNKYYDLNDKQIKIIPFYMPGNNNNHIKISNIIENSIKSLYYRNKKLILPITAGSDSRVLISCCNKIKNHIDFYIFNNKNLKSSNNVDTIVANKYAEKYNLRFENILINNNKLSPSFENDFKNNHIIPRILPKTKNIEYHYNNSQGKININGNCAEVIKEHFNNNKNIKSFKDFKEAIKMKNNMKYIETSLKYFFDNSINECNKYNIDICNLYHWELQQGLWGSLFPLEQDIAIEEFSPFNNREVLLLGLSVNREDRLSKNQYPLFKNIINNKWPDLMYQKFNPKLNEII
jgi:hypothetical protein